MVKKLLINDTEIPPGQETTIKIPAGRLPSGGQIKVHVQAHRSKKDGPVVLLLGGLHGDEVNGIEIIRKCLDVNLFKNLLCGTVIAMPLINVFGFINFSRDLPDGKDVNRSFPGNMSGSLASRIARILSKHILPVVDLGIDFHTGGASRYNYPQIRVSPGDAPAMELAEYFKAPYVIAKAPIRKSLRRTAKDLGRPIIVYEGGEASRFDGLSIDEGFEGLQRCLLGLGMLASAPEPKHPTVLLRKSGWIRASVPGLFLWSIESGHFVKKSQHLGVINDPYGEKSTPVVSNIDGYVIGHNNAPVVNQGDALFHIANPGKQMEW
jgi:uncharacterized protein